MRAEPDNQARPDPVRYPCPRQALRSLRRYPLPLRSGKEAKILQHFGDRLCRMLDQRLQQHEASGGERKSQGRWSPEPPPGAASITTWDTLASGSPLTSKLLFDLRLVAGLPNLTPLTYHGSWQRSRPSRLLDSVALTLFCSRR